MSWYQTIVRKGSSAPKWGALRSFWLFCGVVLFMLGLGATPHLDAKDPQLTDTFEDRELLPGASGKLDSSNVGASLQVKEPVHSGRIGGSSVWVSWVAPEDGVMTLSTAGSGFDTVLAVYRFQNVADTTLDKLAEVGWNDDGIGQSPTSLLQFGALAGVRYEISIDGFKGASGSIHFSWDFLPESTPPPVILSLPNDRAARQGDPVTLTVDMVVTPGLSFQWRLNGDDVVGAASDPTLVIPSLSPADVGLYTLRIRIDRVRFETSPVEVQINSDGQTNALARDKLFDALGSALDTTTDDHGGGAVPPAPRLALADVTPGVARGYNGSQIFNTVYATVDPAEPQHCGVSGGASYWFLYQAPTNGTVVLDTIGSAIDTVVAAYSFTPPLTSYAELIPVVCDNDSVGVAGAARIEFATIQGRQYAIVVDGVNGARGLVKLNYVFDSTRPPVVPTVVSPPVPITVVLGSEVRLQPNLIGSPPLHFSWTHGGVPLVNATNATLVLSSVSADSVGDYFLSVWNHIDTKPITIDFPLHLLTFPQWNTVALGSNTYQFTFPTLNGVQYFIEQKDRIEDPWQSILPPVVGDGKDYSLTNQFTNGSQFFRIRID